MRVRKTWSAAMVAAALLALSIPAFCFNADVSPAERNAILFSWDGVQREHLNECLSRNEMPNLAALVSEGGMVDIDVTHKTDTKAGHTQMLTGYDPETTGVYSNGDFRAIPEGLTIFERLEKAFGDDNIATIMLTGKSHHIGSCPPSTPEQIAEAKTRIKERGKRLQEARRIVQNEFGEPWCVVKNNFDVWDGDRQREHTVVGPLALEYLDKYGKGRFFAFFHFSDPDHKGHAHGENSEEYNSAIIACDRWLGRIVSRLKALGIYDKTMVFVNADHGFDEGEKTHGNAPYVFLAANHKGLTKDGDQRDIVPTILREMGVDISKARPKYTGVVLTAK